MIRPSVWLRAVALAGSGLVSACTAPLPPLLPLAPIAGYASIPQQKIFLKNRTSRSFACTVSAGTAFMRFAFTLAPEDEYYRDTDRAVVTMRCGGASYALAAGSRYAIQPVGAGFAVQEIVP